MPRLLIATGICLGYLALILFSGSISAPYSDQALLPGPLPDSFQKPDTKDQKPEIFLHRWLGSGTVDRQWSWQQNLKTRYRVNHNAHTFLKPEDFETHPEWFPWIQGKRVPLAGGKGPNPNYAHPDFAKHVAVLASEHFEENPDAHSFSLSVTDSLKFDESELTRDIIEPLTYFRGRPDYSDLVFTFANRVAEATFGKSSESRHQNPETNPKNALSSLASPGKKLSPPTAHLQPSTFNQHYLTSYAYYWAENSPGFPIHEKVIPFLTSDRSQWWDPEYRKNDQALIRRWAEAGAAFIGGRDYYMGEGYFIPRVYPTLAAESIRFLARNNARAFYAEGRPIWGFDAPTYWLAAQMLNDPGQDSQALLNRFFTSMYGPAAEPMRAFFDRCEEIWMNQPGSSRWIKAWRHASQAELFPPAVCEELMEILLVAYGKVGGALRSESAFPVQQGRKGEAERRLPSPRSAFHLSKTGLYQDRIELTLQAFAFTTAASHFYQAWKALAANPLQSEQDHERFRGDRQNFRRQASRLNRYPDIGGSSPRWNARDNLLRRKPEDRLVFTDQPGLDPPGPVPPPIQKTVFSFDSPVFSGDLDGLDGWALRDTRLKNGLSIAVEPTEHFEFRRLPGAGIDESGAIRIEASNYTALNHWLAIEPGQTLKANVRYRGHFSIGARLSLYVVFRDANLKEHVASTRVEESPQGFHNDWLSLAIREIAPPDTRWVQVTLRILYQQPGDLVLLDDLDISVEP